jgi:uncharacterized protein (DUF2235 family)
MPRKLVLCLDGTSNRYCRDNTNVVKLAALLDKSATDQLLYYQPGIGTIAPPSVFSRTWKWILTRLDLAFAILLKDHVQDAYRFLMRYYEDGDQIFIFGFSRGAYTARVLAGMLCKVGLLSRGNEELVPFAWARYANREEDERDPEEKKRKQEETRGFQNTFSRRVPVEFIGVWDTVSSVRYAGCDQHFAFTFDNPIVRKTRHAMALDERRAYFRQNLWKEPARAGQDLRQVWFPGVHCDVGGGYAESESGLAKMALRWMLDEIGPALKFHPTAIVGMLPKTSTERFAAPLSTAKIHESLRGVWHIVELIPKRVSIRQADNTWQKRWIIPRGHHRKLPDDAIIHPGVYERMRLDGAYRPPNLPGSWTTAPVIPAPQSA